ncbi:unnamed protein product [Bathycoccus prasinos]
MQRIFPRRRGRPSPLRVPRRKNRVFVDPSTVLTAILACANNSSSDIAGVCFEHVKSLLGRAHSGGKNHFLSFFSFLIEEVARDPAGKCFKALSTAKYIAIAKPKSSVPGDIRPIGHHVRIPPYLRQIRDDRIGKIIGRRAFFAKVQPPVCRWRFFWSKHSWTGNKHPA